MAYSTDSVKLRSLGLWSFLLATTPLLLGGCIIVEEDGYYGPDDPIDTPSPPITEQPMLVSIDTDAVIDSEPGEGVGIFVQYAADGLWKIWTACDTNTSKVVCIFDVYAAVDVSSELIQLTGEDLESRDQTTSIKPGEAHFHAETGSDIDTMTFSTTPGAVIRLEAYLDGYSQPRFVYWFGDGVLHQGAPTNPIDFEPTTP